MSLYHTCFEIYTSVCLVRVVIDNEACKNATVIRVWSSFLYLFVSFLALILVFGGRFGTYTNFLVQVDSANKLGILLEVVQILTDLNLIVTKAYISSDGGWFMDGNTRFRLLFFFTVKSLSK